MNYIILKRNNYIVIIAEDCKKRFEIMFENEKFITISIYDRLSFNHVVNSWKQAGFKKIEKFTVRQNNEKNL